MSWKHSNAIASLLLALGSASAQAPAGPYADDAPIYGSQMMTTQERQAYRERMRTAKTAEERERLRLEHHEQMVLRARERGITLPDQPPMRGGGMGPGTGAGRGPGGGGPGPLPGGPNR